MDATPAELAELKSVFKAECEEHLTALDSLLLKLEQAPENALVLQETFRRVHSVNLTAPVGRTGIDFDQLEALVAGNLGASDRGGIVGAAIQPQHEAQLRMRFGAQ